MSTLVDYPTFADSPFFFDRRYLHIPQPETAHVQVCIEMNKWMAGCMELTVRAQDHSAPTVSYYHPKDVGNFHYGVSRLRNSSQCVLALTLCRKGIPCDRTA